MRPALVRLPIVLVAIFALACSGDRTITAPDPSDDAFTAADGFARLADSVALTQGEDAALAYRDASDQIRTAGHLSRITVSIDGTSESWNAVAGERTFNIKCPTDAPTTAAGISCNSRPVVTRTLIAWRGTDPRRMLYLTTPSESGDIGSFSVPTIAVLTVAHLQLVEGRERFWAGTSGTYASTMKTGPVCPTAIGLAVPQSTEIKCNLAEFTWTLDATLEPARGLPFANAARVSHKISIRNAEVVGTRVEVTFSPPVREPMPLTASLTANVNASGDDVTLAFTVRNATEAPLELHFNSTQEYDFRIATRAGEVLWTWSALADFAATATTRVLPASGAVTYTAHWKPTAHGQLLVSAVLTTREPRLIAIAPLAVP